MSGPLPADTNSQVQATHFLQETVEARVPENVLQWLSHDGSNQAAEELYGYYDDLAGIHHLEGQVGVGVGAQQFTVMQSDGESSFHQVFPVGNYRYRGVLFGWTNFPPAAPQLYDIVDVLLTSSGTQQLTATQAWRFLYIGAGQFPWYFLGGAPLAFPGHDPNAAINTLTNTGQANGLGWEIYYDPAAALAVPRPGIYTFRGSQLLNYNFASGSVGVSFGPITSANIGGNQWVARAFPTPGNRFDSIAYADTVLIAGSIGSVLGQGLASDNPGDVFVRWNGGSVTPLYIS